jgi:hypothetical protein
VEHLEPHTTPTPSFALSSVEEEQQSLGVCESIRWFAQTLRECEHSVGLVPVPEGEEQLAEAEVEAGLVHVHLGEGLDRLVPIESTARFAQSRWYRRDVEDSPADL